MSDRRVTATDPGSIAQAMFQQEWQIYRKMVDNNYLYHREAYACLRSLLNNEAVQPFRFLDIACGDASESITVLRETQIASYRGIDLSRTALDLARATLSELNCPVTLEQADFADALEANPAPADFAWIGLSLHHFRAEDKVHILRLIREIVGDHGILAVYEPSCPEGETRDEWLERWAAQESVWTAYSRAEWEVTLTHSTTADFPETPSGWRNLGREAGFFNVQERFVAPSDLLRLYSFRA